MWAPYHCGCETCLEGANPPGYPRPMGPSIGFVRSYLSIASLIVLALLTAGTANETFGIGWWERGYPVSGGGFGSFVVGWGALFLALVGINLVLDRFERPGGER